MSRKIILPFSRCSFFLIWNSTCSLADAFFFICFNANERYQVVPYSQILKIHSGMNITIKISCVRCMSGSADFFLSEIGKLLQVFTRKSGCWNKAKSTRDSLSELMLAANIWVVLVTIYLCILNLPWSNLWRYLNILLTLN